MLEEHVVFVSHTTDSAEHIASHEVVSVRAKPIDDLCESSQLQPPDEAAHSVPRLTSWSSQILSCGICPLAVEKGSVLYHLI